MVDSPIVITGASGFLGSALVSAVQQRGWPVIGVTRFPQERRRASGQVVWMSWEEVPHVIAKSRAVIHVATSYGRNESEESIREAIIELPLKLARVAAMDGVPFLSADTFFRILPQPYEYLRTYTDAKQVFRDQMQLLAQGAIPAPFLIIYHMVGPGDRTDKSLPALVRRIVQDQGRLALTDGTQVRDFIHVNDVASAFISVLEGIASFPNGVVDIPVGSGVLTCWRDVLVQVHQLAKSSIELGFGDIPRRCGEPDIEAADQAILRQLGWRPQYLLEDALRSMILEVSRE